MIDNKQGLIKVLNRLSLTGEEIKNVPAYKYEPEELTEDFLQIMVGLPYIVENGRIDYDTIALILHLNNCINVIVANNELSKEDWSNNESWKSVRLFAKEILEKLV